MKRIDLIRHLQRHGCDLLREGRRHTVYVNRAARKVSAVPGHRDIDLLAPAEAIPALVTALEPLSFLRREREPSRLAEGAVIMHRLTRVLAGDPDVLVLDVVEVGSGATAVAWALPGLRATRR